MSTPPPDKGFESILPFLSAALEHRSGFFEPNHNSAFRLFSGFHEGYPELVVDLYGQTLVLFDYSKMPVPSSPVNQGAARFYLERLPWLRAIVLKAHHAADPGMRRGVLVEGTEPDQQINEHGVRYALDLLMNQDASFYLDTRDLRRWIMNNLGGRSVFNTFAFTGSLGIAAVAGGARRVLHLDANRKFLNIAKRSYELNGFSIYRSDFISGDFWEITSRLRHSGSLFDCVILDPPYFAKSRKGFIDLQRESLGLINKVRPLVGHEGYLVIVNNALFLSGEGFMSIIQDVCSSGYIQLESIIPVLDDVGIPRERWIQSPPADPAPFNHSTKIAILRVERKDKQRALALETVEH